jgi:hypothetical protein
MELDTVDSIVRGALIDVGETTSHKYPKFLQWGLEAFKDYIFDSAQQTITVRLPMNNLKQVVLPNDYIDWVKVGIQCGDRIKILNVNDDIARIHATDDCGCPVPFEKDCEFNHLRNDALLLGGYYFFNFNQFGENLGGIYGHGGGYHERGFTVIKEASPPVIQLDGRINNTMIYLEYLASGFCPGKETLVNPYFAKAIKEYIHWRRLHFSGAVGQAAEAERIYYNELSKARYREMALTTSDILRASRRYYGQAIKQ